jgi:hypothetical protein
MGGNGRDGGVEEEVMEEGRKGVMTQGWALGVFLSLSMHHQALDPEEDAALTGAK